MQIQNQVKKYIKFLIPERFKKVFRKIKRKISRPKGAKLSLVELEDIIVNKLGIKAGDTIIVHSSFGNLFGDFSPFEVINLLMKIITESGNILMPYYPSGQAYYWIQKNNVFDVYNSHSCMGILTDLFKNVPGVKLSPHPVKAMAVWGKDRDFLIKSHHCSIHPYDQHSPYYRTTLLSNAKTIGLGIEINSFIHCCEDLFLRDKFEIYAEKEFHSRLKYYNGDVEVKTFLHDPVKIRTLISGCSFLKETNFLNYNYFSKSNIVFFSTSNNEVLEHCQRLFSKGITRNPVSLSKFKNEYLNAGA